MTQLYNDKQVILAEYLSEDTISFLSQDDHFISYQSGAHIWCETNCDSIFSKLNPIFNNLGYIKIYQKSDIPEIYHYKNSPRIPPLLISCNLPYQVFLKEKNTEMKGTHGYENYNNPDMHPIFIAAGKKIKSNTEKPGTPLKIEPFNNIHLYSLFCAILDLEPNQFNNGSINSISHILK